MTFTLRQLQEEQRPWVLHNFGERPSWMPLMGVVEELGELVEAATGSEDCLESVGDAIADCIIFLADYCTAMSWELQSIWERRTRLQLDTPERARRLLVAVGRMQHHHLKRHQGIRGDWLEHESAGQEAAAALLAELVHIWAASAPGHPDIPGHMSRGRGAAEALLELVEHTWSKVRQRDWKANPQSGSAQESSR